MEKGVHKKKCSNGLFSKLPIDVIYCIFCRLPLKSISQCRWVSKIWYDLIQHPNFAEFHFSRNKSKSPCAVFFKRFGLSYLIEPECLDNFETLVTAYALKLREDFTIMKKGFEVVGTVNGLVCFLLYGSDCSYYICNPITRDYLMTPLSPKKYIKPLASGFGFDSVSNQYKLIRVLRKNSGNMAEVYTLGSDTWREIPVSIPYIITFMKRSSLAINGCVHWLVISRNDHDYGIRFILSFNVNTDEFSIIETPSPVNNHVNFGFVNNLMVLGERLCFIYGDGLFRGEEIWVMKDYGVHSSWSKEYVFHRKVFHPLSRGCHEVMELQNKKLLLLDKMSNLGYFDLENKIFSSISVRNINNYPVLMDTKIKMDKRVDSDYFPIYLTGSLFSPKTGLMDKRVDFTIKKKMDKRVDSDSFPIYLIGELNYLATISACSAC